MGLLPFVLQEGVPDVVPANGPVENRLARFNHDRNNVLSLVRARLIQQYTHGGESTCREVLEEAVYHEVKRLEASRKQQKGLNYWRGIARQLRSMGQSEIVSVLSELLSRYGKDVVGNFDPRVYRFVSSVMPPAMSFVLSPVRSIRGGASAFTKFAGRLVIRGPTDKIEHCFRTGRVVVTPTHSSNMDSIMIGLALERLGLPPVTYGAGKNLFTNPFISFFMRNLGAYRVDRRLGFRLYKDVLKEYSTVLLERGFHSLFFPGGTRCRSNAVESHLKLGLLGTAVAAYRNGLLENEDRPVYILPVTINYRLVLEAETLIEDFLADDGDQRYIISDDEFSRLGRLVEFARKMLTMDGSVIVNFSEPLDVVGNQTDASCLSVDRRGRRANTSDYFLNANGEVTTNASRESQYTRILGSRLAAAFRDDTILHDTNILSRVFYEEAAATWRTNNIYELLRLAPHDVSLPIGEVVRRADSLRQQYARHVFLADKPIESFVSDGLEALQTYHTNEVLSQRGEMVSVADWKLLYYYQNRLANLEPDE